MGKYTVIAVAVFLGACATPNLDIDDPTSAQYEAAEDALKNTELEPAQGMTGEAMTALNRARGKIEVSAYTVCKRLELDTCGETYNARMLTHVCNKDINAYADEMDNIGMYGGLIENAGGEDEIAAVLAHELLAKFRH